MGEISNEDFYEFEAPDWACATAAAELRRLHPGIFGEGVAEEFSQRVIESVAPQLIAVAVAGAIAAERKRCAKIAENYIKPEFKDLDPYGMMYPQKEAGEDIAQAIRSGE